MKPRFLAVLVWIACGSGLIVFANTDRAEKALPGLVAQVATYEPGQSLEPLRRFEALVRQAIVQPALRIPVEAALVKLLEPSSSFPARRWACKQLGIVGSDLALPTLARLLQSDATASIASLALSTYPSGKADELLRKALVGATGQRRIQIVDTLGDRRDPKCVRILAHAARENDPALAEAAVAALGKIANPAAAQVLTELRRTGVQPSSAITEALLRCAQGLANAGDRNGAIVLYQHLLTPSEPVYVRRSALSGLIRLDKDQGEKRILQVLHGTDSALKPVAIAAVRSVSSKGATERFAFELPALQPDEQVWMIESLAARGDAAARDAAGASLDSPNANVRRAAINALGSLGDQTSVPLLARALARSHDPEEGRSIEVALKQLRGGADTDSAIIAELVKASGEPRAHLIAALAPRQGRAANEWLLHEIRSPEPVVAKAAFRALGSTATAGEIAAVLQCMNGPQDAEVRAEAENAAARALARVDPPRRSLAVRDELVRAHTAESRCSFLGLLPGCGGPAALSALKTGVGDDDSLVRLAAVRALGEWPDDAAWDILAGIYRQPETDTVRDIALRALVRLASDGNSHPDAKLVDNYRQLLDAAKNQAELRQILGALGGLAHPDALQLAVPLLDNAAVRPEAEIAVKKIADAIKEKYPDAAQEALSHVKP
jgi:HEAT repeat protein